MYRKVLKLEHGDFFFHVTVQKPHVHLSPIITPLLVSYSPTLPIFKTFYIQGTLLYMTVLSVLRLLYGVLAVLAHCYM